MRQLNTAMMRFVIGLAVTVVFCLLLFQNPLPLEMVEAKLYDFRFHARGVLPPPDRVVIAAIDEKSLQRLGRWPWSREVMARLVDRLTEAQAAVVAFDVIFPEGEDNDGDLARAIDAAGNVILPFSFDLEGKTGPPAGSLLEQSAVANVADGELYRTFPPIASSGSPTLPVASLAEKAMSLGHINMLPDHFDGTLRWETLLIAHQNRLYPSLGLRSAAFFKGIPPDRLTVKATRSIGFGQSVIPTDCWGRMPINYYGPDRTIRHISAADILDGSASAGELANKIVFIGATALGVYDLRVTPFSAAMPGVEKQATVAASILENRLLAKATTGQDLAFLLATGLLLALALSRLRLLWGAVATVTVMAATGAVALYLFDKTGLWVNLASPLANSLGIFMSVTAWNYAFEERRARKIRAMFSSYVTTTIVNELIANPELARLGGQRREVTVLFSDVRGFTSFSEQHQPEEVVALLNEYLEAMTGVVLNWGGTLDKFIGDAIMVFWNAPIPAPDHASRAVRCALEMQQKLAELHAKWEGEGKPRLSCGIGINTGEVIVGNIGAERKKMDYTVIGDHVNLASRVESLTRHFEADILVTGMTLEKLRPEVEAGRLEGVEFRGLRPVVVKGKEHPVALYHVVATAAPATIAECPELGPLRLAEK